MSRWVDWVIFVQPTGKHLFILLQSTCMYLYTVPRVAMCFPRGPCLCGMQQHLKDCPLHGLFKKHTSTSALICRGENSWIKFYLSLSPKATAWYFWDFQYSTFDIQTAKVAMSNLLSIDIQSAMYITSRFIRSLVEYCATVALIGHFRAQLRGPEGRLTYH